MIKAQLMIVSQTKVELMSNLFVSSVCVAGVCLLKIDTHVTYKLFLGVLDIIAKLTI